jgi:hypothetical protein
MIAALAGLLALFAVMGALAVYIFMQQKQSTSTGTAAAGGPEEDDDEVVVVRRLARCKHFQDWMQYDPCQAASLDKQSSNTWSAAVHVGTF